ncbi:MAG: NADH-quinone oxidoreductase subunit NuoF [Gammaproteobacteria bacterium]|jgi:NADH-quinone oxidoreductase subunit F|nr:NADH-quinone oxidoreductase subunit NuoF [Gammaproteobacteria bacterium]MBT6041996.1 NADH-quinone oxidoreductase subunit NuoF [Gammaproteobacteria bacterium]
MDKPLTKNIEEGRAPFNFKQYEAAGGYDSVRKVVTMAPNDVVTLVKDAGLGGRGGAGFNTGLKWSFVPAPDGGPRYLVINGDEMEPGTFKDRLLMENDPHLLVEGMITTCFALQSSCGYIFLRGEYTVAEERLLAAIAEAYENGMLGKNILGSGFDLDIYLHTSAGRYICGEETALINALEGKRANPRAKPPFPQVSGLWGRPTVVNNVETICNIPGIVANGVDWYQGLGLGEFVGTRISGVSGRVNNPGCWEVPVGITFRQLLEDYAGGMQDGYELKAFLPGGGSTDFLMPEHLDLVMDPGAVQKAGSRLGTSLIMVLDDKTCPVGCIRNLIKFFAHESCGWCTPCRDGLPWTEQMLDKLEEGTGSLKDIEILKEMTGYMGIGNTFCALAPGAMEPLQSGLKYFIDEFEAHVDHGCGYSK